MKQFWQKAEQFWNGSRILAGVLVIVGIAFAVGASICPQSPGVSIGLLAAAAGIMSLRPTTMHPAERFAWVGVLIAFAVLEVRAIGRNDKAAEAVRDSQNRAFQRIVDGLKESIAKSKNEYDSTIGHVDSVLKTTKEVAALAKRNLENTTGGDSYAFVYPVNFIESNSNPLNCRFRLNIHNDGNQILTGVTVKLFRVVEGAYQVGSPTPGKVIIRAEPANPLEVGILAPHMGEIIPRYVLSPDLNPDSTAAYHVMISSQNGGSSEDIYFRPSKDGRGLAYRFRVSSLAFGKRKDGDIHEGDQWYRIVKTRDWTEPTYEPTRLP